jgi:hypothetical protein
LLIVIFRRAMTVAWYDKYVCVALQVTTSTSTSSLRRRTTRAPRRGWSSTSISGPSSRSPDRLHGMTTCGATWPRLSWARERSCARRCHCSARRRSGRSARAACKSRRGGGPATCTPSGCPPARRCQPGTRRWRPCGRWRRSGAAGPAACPWSCPAPTRSRTDAKRSPSGRSTILIQLVDHNAIAIVLVVLVITTSTY